MAQTVVDIKPISQEIDPIENRPSLVIGEPGFHGVTESVARAAEWTPPIGWYITFTLALAMLGVFGISLGWLLIKGTGIWGNNNPVAWGWPIVNFVFWVGIGHAGTLISAVLFLFRQKWRTSINRAAEAMTIFAVMCALVFPGIHTGRPWVDYWMMPYPNEMGLWPQFRSPLMWDVFAVSIYFTVSLIFWYLGLIPDMATMRDRAKNKFRKFLYGTLALGWRGSQRHWTHYEKAYLLLAGLATPLVLSVHSIVSFDFAVSQLPGWHSTIFPPYFVAGAIFLCIAGVFGVLWLAANGLIDLGLLLGLCGFKQRLHLPCPTCGVTTASLAFVKGRVFEAFLIQPAGGLLCCVLAVGGFFAFIIAVFGVYLRYLERLAREIHIKYVVLVVVIVVLAAWAVTFVRALAVRG